ncbi:MAG TPA: hypothetical protein VMI73_18130 [Trebonia sp.]|nr:hypothetical protein [Trebonia sp.]
MSRVISVRGRGWLAAAAAVGAGVLALGAVTGTAASAGAAPANGARLGAAPKWHIVKSVKTDFSGQFTAVVATGKTTAWAFDGNGESGVKATAWRENGTTWTKVAFPSVANEEVVAAGADSPNDVWAFTQNFSGPSRVLRWNGSRWAPVKSFSAPIGDATVLSGHAVWVYGWPPVFGTPTLGVWFYNGKTWTQVSKTIAGGSALSNKNVWGYTATSVEHWNGAKWIATSVKKFLPATDPHGLNNPSVAGILALSPSNVYALGSGDTQDEGGPLVVLHFNGGAWTKVAAGQFGAGPGPQFSSDGAGGLWLPMDGPVGGTSFLVHYAAGKLTKATLPVSAPQITIGAVGRIPGTAAQLAGGFTHKAGDRGTGVVAVLLQYS